MLPACWSDPDLCTCGVWAHCHALVRPGLPHCPFTVITMHGKDALVSARSSRKSNPCFYFLLIVRIIFCCLNEEPKWGKAFKFNEPSLPWQSILSHHRTLSDRQHHMLVLGSKYILRSVAEHLNPEKCYLQDGALAMPLRGHSNILSGWQLLGMWCIIEISRSCIVLFVTPLSLLRVFLVPGVITGNPIMINKTLRATG